MSVHKPVAGSLPIVSEPVVSTDTLVDDFVRRLSAHVDAADEQIGILREEAHEVFVSREKRLGVFSTAIDHVCEILLSRLTAFRQLSIFSDVVQSISPEPADYARQRIVDRTAVLVFPLSDERPRPLEVSFCVGHDPQIERVIIDFRVTLLPIFIEFENNDCMVIPVSELNDDRIFAWIEEKLLGFMQTYFKVIFNKQYQRNTLVTDPVLRISFPKSMAFDRSDYADTAYYFFTDDSSRRFIADPKSYVGGYDENERAPNDSDSVKLF